MFHTQNHTFSLVIKMGFKLAPFKILLKRLHMYVIASLTTKYANDSQSL